MFDLINNLINYFGFATIPDSFPAFIQWFVCVIIGMEFLLFVIDGLFFTVRSIGKGLK